MGGWLGDFYGQDSTNDRTSISMELNRVDSFDRRGQYEENKYKTGQLKVYLSNKTQF